MTSTLYNIKSNQLQLSIVSNFRKLKLHHTATVFCVKVINLNIHPCPLKTSYVLKTQNNSLKEKTNKQYMTHVRILTDNNVLAVC